MKYNYDFIDEILSHFASPLLAEEIHALACGTLVTGKSKIALWLTEIFPETEIGKTFVLAAQQKLLDLYEHIDQELADSSLPFTLLLPDDEAPLGERVEALSEWCRSFLYGTAIADLDNDALSENSQEMLHDILNITTTTIDFTENEENEQAYQEVIEYIRVGVVFIYEESRQEN